MTKDLLPNSASKENDTGQRNYDSVSIQQLREVLLKPVGEAAFHFRGFLIENLSINPNASFKPWRNGARGFSISDQNGYKARMVIPEIVWDRAIKNGYNIRNDTAIDAAIDKISIDNWMQLQIEVLAVRVSGVSKVEALREQINSYCEQKGYFTRKKKALPSILRRIAIITTEGSTIESDIINNIDMKKHCIDSYRFNGTAPSLRNLINKVANRHEHDLIALYRGGREDEFMFIFSDPSVLDAVVQSPIPVVTAIGHERDNPPVQLVADMGFASPIKLAEFVSQLNARALNGVYRTIELINGHTNQILKDHQKYLTSIIATIVET